MVRISRVKGLIKHPRSRVFWFRRVVPKEFRGPDKIGKREIKFSLKTTDLREAEIAAAQHWTDWSIRFGRLAGSRSSAANNPTNQDLAQMALWWRDAVSAKDDFEETLGIPELKGKDAEGRTIVDVQQPTPAERLAARAKELRTTDDKIHANNMASFRIVAENVLNARGFSADDDSIERLAPALAAAEKDAIEIQLNRLKAESALPILQRDPLDYVTSEQKVSRLLDDYLIDTKPRIQTRDEWWMIFRRFIDVVGDKPIRRVSKADVRDFRQAVEQLPTRPNKAIRDLPVQEMIRHAAENQMPRLSVETVRKHISAVRAVFEWAVNNDLLDHNPAQKMAPKKEPPNEKRLSFNQSDLAKIFDPRTYYDYPANAADFWMPLICLYSGARIEEVAQLHCTDIQYEENIACLDIAPTRSGVSEDDVKNVKTHSSARRIPIHEEIIRAGFLKFVKERRGDGHTRLFYELDRNKIGRLAREVSRHFSRYIRSVGIADTRKTFHSFRHTFKDGCRKAELMEEIHDRLTGHSSQSVGRYYGQGHDLFVLLRNLNKVRYPGLPELRWDEWQSKLSAVT
ncbi:MAG: DUF6538 domain-containing protein [Pseudomonadota bacterium]